MKAQKNISNVQGTKETKKANVSNVSETKKDSLKNQSVNVISAQIAKKYKIDYSNLSAKEQKKERGQRRRKIESFISLFFQLKIANDKEGLKGLKETFKTFVNENYTLNFDNVKANELYNAKSDKLRNDLNELLIFARSK